MKLKDIPTSELLRMLQTAERVAGPDSREVKLLRRELDRRKPYHISDLLPEILDSLNDPPAAGEVEHE